MLDMFKIDVNAFLSSLPLMLYGMCGIFAVIIVIVLAIKIMTKLFPASKDENQQQ